MLKFTKMEGLGNDYIYVDCTKNDLENASELARVMSDRHFGIGADGLILIKKSENADFRMQMYNSDGTEAEMCGNGIRCVGKFVYDKGLTTKTNLIIETLAGIKQLELIIKDNKVEKVKVDMGIPILDSEKIPVITDDIQNLNLKVLDKNFNFTCVSMGNPHAIAVIGDDINTFDVAKYGSIIENMECFPNRTNVEFIKVINKKNIEMRVWERGSGETLACGTGACASVVSCILNGYTNRKVNVKLLGGVLEIEWDINNNHIYMTGSATTVFDGTIEI